ncbi:MULTISPECIES: FAD-dependent oxidoreductase [Lactobacillaceae]|nr:FAD-dependent oxidoreductase [Leuconostoc pseudomesenteroides]MCT4379746.1 CoA-disulfide reductase [Leuconostoc pseudomesenteroides]
MSIKTNILIIGGSDAGISAALRAKELSHTADVTLLLDDNYPNLSICGFPYALSGEVTSWEKLRHRTLSELETSGIKIHLSTRAETIRPKEQLVMTNKGVFQYDKLIVGTGALPSVSHITGNEHALVLHNMSDFFHIEKKILDTKPRKVAIIGAGYIGIEVSEALAKRGFFVTIFQRGEEILPTMEPEMSRILHRTLEENGIQVMTSSEVTQIQADKTVITKHKEIFEFDMVLLVTGVHPNSGLLKKAGAKIADNDAVIVNEYMQTNLTNIYASGDLVMTKHRLLGTTYLPLGTTSHKQGRVAGAHAVGISAPFKGVVGSQVIKAFDQVAVRTGLLPTEALKAGYVPFSTTSFVDDHKSYIPGATKIAIRITGDFNTGKLLGAQLIGSFGAEIAKRSDIFSTAIFNQMTVSEISDLDLSYSPPISAPWDAVQQATQAWEKAWHAQINQF